MNLVISLLKQLVVLGDQRLLSLSFELKTDFEASDVDGRGAGEQIPKFHFYVEHQVVHPWKPNVEWILFGLEGMLAHDKESKWRIALEDKEERLVSCDK